MKMSATYSLLLTVALTSLTLTGTFGADIINGKKAKKNSLQYLASVQIDGKHKCGGFLIDPSYVLTAAHCDKRKLKTSKGVKIVKIPRKDKPIKPKSKCLVAGWGKTEQHNVVNDLLVTDVSTINFTVCQTMWRKVKVNLPDNILCAGGFETKSGACQGDSGGPLVCSGIAVGVVSFNLGRCDYPNIPNIYTQISKYLPWIKKVINGGA